MRACVFTRVFGCASVCMCVHTHSVYRLALGLKDHFCYRLLGVCGGWEGEGVFVCVVMCVRACVCVCVCLGAVILPCCVIQALNKILI